MKLTSTSATQGRTVWWAFPTGTELINRFAFFHLVRRFFLLTNGSLLIVNSQTVDTGTYRCNATNQFTKKIFRTFQTEVAVQSRPDNHHNDGGGLLPTLQSSEQKIKSGQNLVLHCASHLNKVSSRPGPKQAVTSRCSIKIECQSSAIWPAKSSIERFSFSFLTLFSQFHFDSAHETTHRFCGHSHHVPATSQSAWPISTMSWNTWMSPWRNTMEFIIAPLRAISRWALWR